MRRSQGTQRSRRLVVGMLALLVPALLLAACGDDNGDADAEELHEITFRLDFRGSPRHGAFHLAKERGYYEEEGLDVRVLDGTGSAETVRLVGAGADDFGLASLAVLASAAGNEGVPVRAIAGYDQGQPNAIYAPADAGIETIQDLEGKSVGAVPGGAGTVLFPAVAEAAGIDASTITEVSVDGGSRTSVFLQGQVDFITAFVFSEVPPLEDAGFDYVEFRYDDYITMLGNGLFTNHRMIEENPDVVEGFVRASLRGIEAAFEDPDASVDALVAARPDTGGSRENQLRQIELLEQFLHTERTEGETLGWMSPEDWEDSVAIMQEYMELEDVDPQTLFTNDFIPDD